MYRVPPITFQWTKLWLFLETGGGILDGKHAGIAEERTQIAES